jgi:hypothetical protein
LQFHSRPRRLPLCSCSAVAHRLPRSPKACVAARPVSVRRQPPLASWHSFLHVQPVGVPSAVNRCLLQRSENVVRALHQKRSQVTVSFLADVELRFALTGIPTSRTQPEKQVKGIGTLDCVDLRPHHRRSSALSPQPRCGVFHGEVDLCWGAAVSYRSQQAWTDSSQSR